MVNVQLYCMCARITMEPQVYRPFLDLKVRPLQFNVLFNADRWGGGQKTNSHLKTQATRAVSLNGLEFLPGLQCILLVFFRGSLPKNQ